MPDLHRLPCYALAGTPESLPNLPDSFHQVLLFKPRKRATTASQGPESAAPSQVRDRNWWDINTPERLRGSLQRQKNRSANHCGMGKGNGVSRAVLPTQPVFDAREQAGKGFAAMWSGIDIREP